MLAEGGTGEAPAADPIATLDQIPTERPGTLIGPYKLPEQIGEGGVGLAYMAEQQRPSPDGKRLASAATQLQLKTWVWDAATGRKLFTMKGGGRDGDTEFEIELPECRNEVGRSVGTDFGIYGCFAATPT